MKYFDAHTHLNSERLFSHYQQYIDNFVNIWWQALVNIWADHTYNQNALTIACENTNPDCKIYSALGLHPCEVQAWQEEYPVCDQATILTKFTQLRDLVLAHRDELVAIWETGIDLHYINTPENLELQKYLFQLQLDFARELDLPVVIHSRDAFAETLEVLQAYLDIKIYFHCWGYWPDEAKKLLENFPNVLIGFTGNVSYPKAQGIRDSLHLVPTDKLLLETDAPYLSPQSMRGKTNEPAFIQYVYDFISQEFASNPEKLEKQIEKNFRDFYGLN